VRVQNIFTKKLPSSKFMLFHKGVTSIVSLIDYLTGRPSSGIDTEYKVIGLACPRFSS